MKFKRRKHNVPEALYHGSPVAGIDTLEPRARRALRRFTRKRPVVFATGDPRFAVAMIPNISDEVTIGYLNDRFFVEERKPGGLKKFKVPGTLYTVPTDNFVAGARNTDPYYEVVSVKPVPTLTQQKIESVLDYLRKNNAVIIRYNDGKR